MSKSKSSLIAVSVALLATLGSTAHAQDQQTAAQPTLDSANGDNGSALPTIIVNGNKFPIKLDQESATASRLGLTARETPAAIDTIDAATIETRGYQTAEQAVDSLPGITSGGSPGSPSQFSMRGLTGNEITILRDGLYLGPAGMTYRPQNTFNLSGIDVLKGPNSVLYGQGAVGGTVNVVTKNPSFSGDTLDAVASYGSFNTSQVGIGGNVVISDTVAFRGDISRTSSDGFIKNTPSDSLNGTFALLIKPNDRLDFLLSLDILNDNISPYFGTPLVPTAFATDPLNGVLTSTKGLTLDKRMTSTSYNVGDYQDTSTQYIPRLLTHWKLSDDVLISNDLYYFYADRKWKNAETYTFNTSTNLIDRDRFFVFHQQHLYGDQLSATFSQPLAGFSNRFVAGLAYSKLDFVRSRGFPDGDSVDPFNPVAGTFGPVVARKSPTHWEDIALFFEDALDVTSALKLVGGVRAENFKLNRENYDVNGNFVASTSFTRTFNPFNARIGAIYQITPDISPYVQYSTGQDPAGSNILLVNKGQDFDLSRSKQFEAGIKTSFDQKRGEATLAYYDIQRKNILTQTSTDTVTNVGSQKSSGVEFSLNYTPISAWNINGNLAYTDSRYGSFIDSNTGINDSGNRPDNIPKWTANLWNSYSGFGGIPLEVGAGVKYVGDRYGDSANTLLLKKYTLLDLYGTYRIDKNLKLTARVNNVFDKDYVQWADINYPDQVLLGTPRSIEVSLVAKF